MNNSIEFYTFDSEVWYRTLDGKNEQLTEVNRDVVRFLIEKIKEFYPEALKVLEEEYKACLPNILHFQYRIAMRFCRCNFGTLNTSTRDIDRNGKFNLEKVDCPLRGDCKHEDTVCNPKFNSKISDSEMRVLELVYNGYEKAVIADKLCLSLHTVNNHIRNAYTRLRLHEKSEFFKYAYTNNLFKEEK